MNHKNHPAIHILCLLVVGDEVNLRVHNRHKVVDVHVMVTTQLCWGCNSHVVVFQDLVIGDGLIDDSFMVLSKGFDGSCFIELSLFWDSLQRFGELISACNSVCKLLLLGSDVVGIPGQLDASIPQAVSKELSGCLLGVRESAYCRSLEIHLSLPPRASSPSRRTLISSPVLLSVRPLLRLSR